MKNLALPLVPAGPSAPTSYVVSIDSPIEGATPAIGVLHVAVSVVPEVDASTVVTVRDGASVVGTGTVGAGVDTSALASGAHVLTASISVDSRTWTSAARSITCVVPAITFQSLGPEIRPRLHLYDGTNPTVLWTWADGTTSQSLTPAYVGSAGMHTLRVDPPTAIEAINFGYDGGDGGDQYAPLATYAHPSTNLSAITNLSAGAPNLRRFLANHTAVAGVNLSGLPMLHCAEFYLGDIAVVDYAESPLVRRVCHENTAIQLLDLRDATAIEDVRGRGQQIGTTPFRIELGDVSNLWHFCVGDQAGGLAGNCLDLFDGTVEMPSMNQWWTWGSRVGGALTPRGTMQSLLAQNSLHTSFSAANLTWPAGGGQVDLSGNPLTSLDFTGMGVGGFDVLLRNCNLSQALVDYALEFFATGTGTNGTLDLTGCAIPSAAGLVNRDALLGRGWEVLVVA